MAATDAHDGNGRLTLKVDDTNNIFSTHAPAGKGVRYPYDCSREHCLCAEKKSACSSTSCVERLDRRLHMVYLELAKQHQVNIRLHGEIDDLQQQIEKSCGHSYYFGGDSDTILHECATATVDIPLECVSCRVEGFGSAGIAARRENVLKAELKLAMQEYLDVYREDQVLIGRHIATAAKVDDQALYRLQRVQIKLDELEHNLDFQMLQLKGKSALQLRYESDLQKTEGRNDARRHETDDDSTCSCVGCSHESQEPALQKATKSGRMYIEDVRRKLGIDGISSLQLEREKLQQEWVLESPTHMTS
ncbi:hypothetical protein LTS10_000180 [Elasticomyces elasticus]|nr:hypothetical protein LTS10_000180 [Elasticomyces elasticus]